MRLKGGDTCEYVADSGGFCTFPRRPRINIFSRGWYGSYCPALCPLLFSLAFFDLHVYVFNGLALCQLGAHLMMYFVLLWLMPLVFFFYLVLCFSSGCLYCDRSSTLLVLLSNACLSFVRLRLSSCFFLSCSNNFVSDVLRMGLGWLGLGLWLELRLGFG